jgi:nicotinamide-nucleotide amidase
VAKAPTEAEAEALVADFEARIRERLGAAIYAAGDTTLEAVVAGECKRRGETLAVAETLTQGDISVRLGHHPDVFLGGVVAPDGLRMADMLRLGQHTVTGEAGAVALARGVRDAWGATRGLAVLSDNPGGPWVAVAGGGDAHTRCLRFRGTDRRARVWTTTMALEFLRRLLLGLADGWAEPPASPRAKR